MSKSCQKVCENCPKVSKISSHLVKPQKPNGAIVEKVQWSNSKKVNGPENNNKKKKIKLVFPRPGSDYVAPGKNRVLMFSN
jgi:hypothetical protein